MESDLLFVVYKTSTSLFKLRIKENAPIPTPPPQCSICGIFQFDDPKLQIGGEFFDTVETTEEGLREPLNVKEFLASLATP